MQTGPGIDSVQFVFKTRTSFWAAVVGDHFPVIWLVLSVAVPRRRPRSARTRRCTRGTSSGIKLAMIAVDDFIQKDKLRILLIMQVHDELVLEVPLVADVGAGDHWDQAH